MAMRLAPVVQASAGARPVQAARPVPKAVKKLGGAALAFLPAGSALAADLPEVSGLWAGWVPGGALS